MISRILIAATIGIILFGIAFFTAKMYSMGIKLSPVQTRNAVIPALFFPFLFILTLITSRSAYMGSFIYTTVNVLAGVFFYLFLGAILIGIILGLEALVKITIPSFIPLSIFGIALILSIAGFIQARFIKTVEYSVTLEDAPASWNGKRAVLVADTHFGLINHEKFSKRVIDHIIALNPDFVLHAGDFYDGPTLDTAPITASWKMLTEKVPMFYAPGNHEGYGNYDAFIQSIRDAGVTVLIDQKTEFDSVQIAGLAYRDRGQKLATVEVLEKMNLDETAPTILINHPPTFLTENEQAGVDLMVSGHTHNGQFWPNNYLVAKVYGIYHYGLNLYGRLHVLTTSGIGTFGPPLRLFNTPELVIIHFKTK